MFTRRAPTVIGPDTAVQGSLVCGANDARVEGQLVGSITSDASIFIEQGARVHGDVSGGIVTVAGVVEGSVIARERLHMRATGRVQGDAIYGTLEVDRGGVVKGQTRTMTGLPVEERPALPEPDDGMDMERMESAPERITAEWPKLDDADARASVEVVIPD